MIGSEESGATAKKRSEAIRRAGGRRSIGADGGVERPERAKLCGKSYVFIRESSRKSTKVRTDQARKSSIVRIVTGETNFLARKAAKQEAEETRLFPACRGEGENAMIRARRSHGDWSEI